MEKHVLVNTITASSFVLGIAAIFFAAHGSLSFSFGLALLAFVADSLDGYVARMLRATSRFGAIFDTAADVIVYLLYPAVVMFTAFGMNTAAGILFIAIFLIAGIVRLVRFTRSGFLADGEKKYYVGMPVFFSHLIIAIMMAVNVLDKASLHMTGSLLLGVMSIAMVTQWKFRKPASAYLGIYMCVILSIAISMFLI